MTEVDIIIPVYNEKENIENTLNSIEENVRNIQGLRANFFVNIIYDFDEDNTIPVIQKIKDKYCFPINLSKNNEGKVINAIKKGLRESKKDYVLVTMADMSDDYEILSKMLDRVDEKYDVICGSRYMRGGKLYGGPFLKQLLSKMAGISLYYLVKIPTHDITNSYKIYKRSFLQELEFESMGGFEIGMEITAKAFIQGNRIAEIPSRWWDRTKGESKFQLLTWLPRYLKWYFYIIKNRFLSTSKH